MPLLVGHALHPFPDNAGLAASCQMFLQYSMMALAAGLLAPLLWGSLWHLALGCAVLTCISMTLLLWQTLRHTQGAKGSHPPGLLTHAGRSQPCRAQAAVDRPDDSARVRRTVPMRGNTMASAIFAAGLRHGPSGT
jgi:hypothetical protein